MNLDVARKMVKLDLFEPQQVISAVQETDGSPVDNRLVAASKK